jgi:threonyl-tRNA synthetase
MGREQQCGTIQVDFSMPGRLGAQFCGGGKQSPYTGHAAPRSFLVPSSVSIGILIEHYEGAFPTWLAPTQVVVMNITDKQASIVKKS